MEEVSARTIVERSIQSWWLVVLAMLVGGLLGYAIHTTRLPIYDARAVFTFNIDYSQTGKLDLTEEDIAIATSANLVPSTAVIQQVIAQAQAEKLPVDGQYVQDHYRYERKSEAWELAVRDTDPVLAARLVNIWAPLGLQFVQEASLHAQKAASIQAYMSSLENCLQRSTSALDGAGLCSISNLTDLQNELASAVNALQQELGASWGVNPAVRYALIQTPDVPVQPTRRGANSMVLAGALAGFIIAAWGVQTSLPSRLARVRRRA